MKKSKRAFKFLFFIIVLFICLVVSIYGYSKISLELGLKSANNIYLYDSNGELYFRGNGTSEWVDISDISDNLITATISMEDKNFYKHFGFDIPRIIKAMYVNVLSGTKKQGASTLSQQYVKNLYLNFDKSWGRKWDEMWLTFNVETHYSKNDILEGYLNTINYGHGMYGIENASKFYFGKSAKELTLSEATMLVGIPKSPSNYSPIVNLELAKERQELVLKSMVNNKYITKEEMDIAYDANIDIIGKKSTVNLSTLMYYQDAVFKELANINSVSKSFLDTGGLKIYTSLDLDAQRTIEDKINKNLQANKNIQVSSVMMNPKNGEIIALVGGRDYSLSQYNRAIQSVRQVGSTMKPILYYSALENGFNSSTSFTSELTTFTFSNDKTYSPKNANDIYANRPISLAAAIAYSDNVFAVKTHIFLGEDTLVSMANRLGITAKMLPIPSLALGTSEINMIELASAYAAFANEGYKINPHFIVRVEDIDGNVLYNAEDDREMILNSSLVYILNELLTTTYDKDFIDYNYPTVMGIANKLTRKYSIKSGTTAADSWTVGYNPELLSIVWCGYDDSSDIQVKDYMYTKDIWADAMEDYFKDKDSSWYKMPSNVVGYLVDPINGKPVFEKSNKKKILYYLRGTEPTGDEAVFDEIKSFN